MDADMDAEIANIRANNINPRSRKSYHASSTKMLLWFLKNKPDVLNPDFAGLFNEDMTEAQMKAAITDVIKGAPENPPLNFENFTARDFFSWLVTLRKRDGEKPGSKAYDTARSALFNLYREFQTSMPGTLQDEMK
ncbi:hypothetical protein HDU96_004294, partial [Phlyctochytrium bullatum]